MVEAGRERDLQHNALAGVSQTPEVSGQAGARISRLKEAVRG